MKIHTARQWTSLALIAAFFLSAGAGFATNSFSTFGQWFSSLYTIVFVFAGALWWMGFEIKSKPTASESTGTETN